MNNMKKGRLETAANRYNAVQMLIDKGIISVDTDKNQVIIHYLLWHSYSESGINKMLYSIWFWIMERAAYNGTKVKELTFDVSVNYTEPNEYHDTGIMEVGQYDGKHLN